MTTLPPSKRKHPWPRGGLYFTPTAEQIYAAQTRTPALRRAYAAMLRDKAKRLLRQARALERSPR